MTADEILKIVQGMEPAEIERLFLLMKDYEAEVRRRQASVRHADASDFARVMDRVFDENKELFQKLAELERRERETAGSQS
jgi:hypothetical protein